MDYGKVLKRAWEITWRWKILWILGFLASLGSGGGGGGGANYTTSGQDFDPNKFGGGSYGPELWAPIAGIIFALVCLFLIIAIVIWVVSIIARGGLIAGVVQVEDEGSTSFRQAWRVGVSRFWTLFGIGVLTALPFIILAILLAIVAAVGVVAYMQGVDSVEGLFAGGIVTAICCGAVFCCGMVILAIVLDQIRTYAERAAILEGLGWIDAFKRGWQVLKENLGPTIVYWIIFFVIGLVLAGLIFAGIMVLVVPVVVMATNIEPGVWLVLPICCGGLLAIIVFAVLAAIIETFTSATWTLAYREMTGVGLQPAE